MMTMIAIRMIMIIIIIVIIIIPETRTYRVVVQRRIVSSHG